MAVSETPLFRLRALKWARCALGSDLSRERPSEGKVNTKATSPISAVSGKAPLPSSTNDAGGGMRSTSGWTNSAAEYRRKTGGASKLQLPRRCRAPPRSSTTNASVNVRESTALRDRCPPTGVRPPHRGRHGRRPARSPTAGRRWGAGAPRPREGSRAHRHRSRNVLITGNIVDASASRFIERGSTCDASFRLWRFARWA
jgi:hypothetical protein